MNLGGRNPEDRDRDRVWVHIDGERGKERVSGRGWNLVFAVVKCHHITELAVSGVDSGDSPSAGAWWPER